MVEIRAFIGEFRVIRKNDESVRKVFGDKQLLFILCGKDHAEPLSVGLRSFADVNSDIENFTGNNPDQFVLREILLKMKSPQDAFFRGGLIVLNKEAGIRYTDKSP